MDITMPIDISCEELLLHHCTFCGWLRREPKMKFLPWRKTYCILADRCFYYFKNECSKSPKGKFPLYGFNKVKRNVDETVKWSFILEHVQPNQKSYTFASSSQQEMVEWMKHIKEEMLRANNRGPRTTADGSSDGSGGSYKRDSLDKIEETVYDALDLFKPLDVTLCSSDSDSDADGNEKQTCSHKLKKLQAQEKLNTARLRIPALPIAVKDKRMPLEGKEEPTKFQIPIMPTRSPAEGRTNPRRAGYELVNKIAVSSEHVTSIPKQPDEKDYWKSIYYKGDKDEATKKSLRVISKYLRTTPSDFRTNQEIIEDIAKDGVFLVRDSDNPQFPKVLVTYSTMHKRAKKFRIFIKKNPTMYYIKDELLFDSVEELIYHYYHNCMTAEEPFKLTEPYLLTKKS